MKQPIEIPGAMPLAFYLMAGGEVEPTREQLVEIAAKLGITERTAYRYARRVRKIMNTLTEKGLI